MFRPDTRADLTRYEVFVEVDGKPYKITRTIQNWTTYGWDTNQGSSQGRRSDYGTFGQKIHDKQAIVIQFAPSYNSKKAGWKEDEKTGIKTLSNKEYLKRAFKILLLDHYKNPQVIEIYDRIEAFESPDARVKVTGTTRKKIPKIPFWPFQGDGKDRYYDYDLKKTRYITKNSKKHFESQRYFKKKITEETIEKIIKKYPKIKAKGVFRLKGGYVLDGVGKYKGNGDRLYHTGKITSIIKKNSPCPDNDNGTCISYTGKKIGGQWIMVKGKKLPKKIYYIQDIKPRFFDTSFIYKFQINDEIIKIKNDPRYLNSFINFDTKEYYEFSYSYYHTREHKQK